MSAPRSSARSRSGAKVAAASRAGGAGVAAVPHPAKTALVLLNEATKFVVAAVAFGVLCYYRNAAVAFALFGSILTSLAGKLLKRLLAHARPAGARKADPGMPSSHAVSLGYLATYAASALCRSGELSPDAARLWAAAAALQALGLVLTALRVVLGYHTVPQVVVGYAFGGGAAMTLHAAANALVLPALAAAPNTLAVLYTATGAAVAVFAAAGAKSWAADAAHVMQLTRSRA